MAEDTSPENLRKFLNSDDPAMARMGISMAKATGIEVTFKDLGHFLNSEDIGTVRNGAMLMEETDIPVAKIIGGLIQNIEKNKDNYEGLIEVLITFGEAALEPLFNISMNNYEYAGWETIEERIGEAAMKALAEIGGPKAVDYLGSMLEIVWSDGTPNWNACCNAADFLEQGDFEDPKIGDIAASIYMYIVKDEEDHPSHWSYDKHHNIGCSDFMATLTSLIEANGLDGLDSSSLGSVHDTLETVFSGYCYECCRWIRPKMVPGWEEGEEVEGCPICESPLEC